MLSWGPGCKVDPALSRAEKGIPEGEPALRSIHSFIHSLVD